MSEQQRKNPRKSTASDEQVDNAEVDTEQQAKLDDDVDSILDDIDDVLEENAEEVVRRFVQKGGQRCCRRPSTRTGLRRSLNFCPITRPTGCPERIRIGGRTITT